MFTLNRHSGGVFAYRFVYAQRAHIIIIFNIFFTFECTLMCNGMVLQQKNV